MKRGRKPGVRTGPNKGSLRHWLSSFALDEVRYREFEMNDPACMSVLRSLSSTTRYPPSMAGWEFCGERFLMISAQQPLTPRVLLKIQRIR